MLEQWGLSGAFALGAMAALHPCPLSTCVAAFLVVLGSNAGIVNTPRRRPSGPFGRAATVVLGMVVAMAAVAALVGGGPSHLRWFSPVVSTVVRSFLPPLLIVAGILQTGVFSAPDRTAPTAGDRWLGSKRLRSRSGLFGLGAMLALSFCPATAGLFFGVLLPLSLTQGHPLAYAIAYALGYGLPLLGVASGLAFGLRLERLRQWVAVGTRLSGWALIAFGAWLTWRQL